MPRLVPFLSATALALTLGLSAPAFADLLTVVPGGLDKTGGGFQGPAPFAIQERHRDGRQPHAAGL